MISLAERVAHEAETGGAPTGFGIPSLLVLAAGIGVVVVLSVRLRMARAVAKERLDGHRRPEHSRP
jgi:hypothetical protein